MNDVQIIKRAAIPAITSIEEGGEVHLLGELRDFNWSEPLKTFLGHGSGFSASWVQLAEAEVLKPHTHPVLSMMVFYAGSGQMIGDLSQALSGDEVVVVPAGCLHGFVGGPGGLYALSIQFARGLYTTPERPRVVFSRDDESLANLLELSQQRAQAFQTRRLFELLEGAAPGSSAAALAKRRALSDALRIWLDGMETLTISRYASCNDPVYQPAFREHLVTCIEPGRSIEPGKPPSRREAARDPALEALTHWFSHQMYVLDNAEKTAIVCLVVDRVNGLLRSAAARAWGDAPTSELFGALGLHADARLARDSELLAHGTPAMYARWKELVLEAWDMAEAMSDRVLAMALGRLET
jgi:hypothetical protein